MHLLQKLLLPILILASFNSNACSCYGYASFCQSTDSESNIAMMYAVEKGDTNLFVGQGNYVKFVIIENLQNGFTTDTITAIGGLGGAMCDINVGWIFDLGDTIISNGRFESCSQGWLRVKNNMVTGYISNSQNETVELERFTANVNACAGVALSYGAAVYPNPTSDILNVIVEDNFLSLHSVEIIDLAGKVCHQVLDTFDGSFEFSVGDLTKGVYFVRAYNSDETILLEKVVIL